MEVSQARSRPEFGVFLPVAKNGFIWSTKSPAYAPSFDDQLRITTLAEDIGLDYVFSMMKWRGFGGETEFWDSSLDSFSLTPALAARTSRIKLIATVCPLLVHPTVMAKMSATVQEMSGGRLGLNIVTGAMLAEYSQMGVVPPDYDEHRYQYASEWVQALKALWREDSVDFRGTYFNLEDCVSEPKPKPEPFLVCAGTSEEGLRFTAREADYGFLSRTAVATLREVGDRMREIAAEEGTDVKTAAPVLVVLKSSESEAMDWWRELQSGVDMRCNLNIAERLSGTGSAREKGRALVAEVASDSEKISMFKPVLGGPAEVTEQLEAMVSVGGLESICLVFPDYVEGLERFGEEVLPHLRHAVGEGTTGGRGAPSSTS